MQRTMISKQIIYFECMCALVTIVVSYARTDTSIPIGSNWFKATTFRRASFQGGTARSAPSWSRLRLRTKILLLESLLHDHFHVAYDKKHEVLGTLQNIPEKLGFTKMVLEKVSPCSLLETKFRASFGAQI
jgi:hypothetical protein